jgi:hypothetical protein
MMNLPRSERLKLEWIEGVQIIICFSFAITLALVPATIVEMVLRAIPVSTPVRVLLIILAVAYSVTLPPIFTMRLLASVGFGIQRLGSGQKPQARQQESNESA